MKHLDPTTKQLNEYADDHDEIDIEQLSLQDLKDLYLSEHKKCIILEKDLFKSMAERRKIDQLYKQLQE